MKKILRLGFLLGMFVSVVGGNDAFAAKKQSAINMGTKVRGRTEATGVYNQDCYDAYYGCMDQFCIVDNEMGGSCNCNDDIKKYESALDEIKSMMAEAERISTEEVEKVQAGANADIVFQGERKYDDKGNVIATKATKNKAEIKKTKWSSLYDEDDEDDEEYIDEDLTDSLAGKIGAELYNAAHKMCKGQMDKSCSKDMTLLTQMYSRQIVSDCKGLANSIEQKKSEAKTALADANRAVRSALRDSLAESNKYDRGTCMVEYKKCMRSEDACGSDWNQCVFTIASENMQNNTAKSVAGTKVKTIKTYDITPSTMEILESKKFICEKVLDSCVAVRDLVWDDFLREAAPTIRLAEQNLESQKRQSCLGDISACIQKACKEDIAGKGTATMDACLSRPDMARSFCKIQIEPCERMEPQIWNYVVSKLAAMRIDACTAEVKECLNDICGKDYSKCVGMDTETIGEMCPEQKLVACMTDGDINTARDYVAEVAQGIALNIDNDLFNVCQNALNESMIKVCGDTESCDKFALDEGTGTRSFKYQVCKYDSISADGITWSSECRESVDGIASSEVNQPNGKGWAGKLSGVMYWGDIEYKQDKKGNYGFTTVDEYIELMKQAGQNITDEDKEIIANQVYGVEIRALENSIKQTIHAIESDPIVTYCMTGRQVEGFDGKKFGKIGKDNARFPNLTNQIREIIAVQALKAARENYNKKYDEEMERMMQDQSKMAGMMNLNEAAQICVDWAQKSTLPASKAPKASNVGTWIAVGVIAAVTVVASIFTVGAASAAGVGVISAVLAGGAAATAANVAVAGAVVAGALAATASPVGKANVDQWNYKMNVTTTFDRSTGECTKVTITQNCKKAKKNYCKKWEEPSERTNKVKLI